MRTWYNGNRWGCVGAALSVGVGLFRLKAGEPFKHTRRSKEHRTGFKPCGAFYYAGRDTEINSAFLLRESAEGAAPGGAVLNKERNRLRMMKKRRSIAALIDGILERKSAETVGMGESGEAGGSVGSVGSGESFSHGREHLARLGEAFLARLSIPQGMSEEEAAEKIIEMWRSADEAGLTPAEGGGSDEGEPQLAYAADAEAEGHGGELENAEDEAELDSPYGRAASEAGGSSARSAKLPAPIRGGLFEAPAADYDSMSAEQFRRLKKQLERASRDGRKVRL